MVGSDTFSRRLMAGIAALFVGLMLACASVAAAGEIRLLMFERDGCSYCKLWHEQIGPAYPKTAQGRAAPLIRLDITDPLPEGVVLTGRAPVFTPTFVLTDDGTEITRIEGYAGDEFFWALLDQMLKRAGWSETDRSADPASDSDAATAQGL